MNMWLILGGGLVLYYLYQQSQQQSTTPGGSGTIPTQTGTPRPTTAPVQTSPAPTPTQAPTPPATQSASPQSTITIPAGFSVHPDINNSLTGNVVLNGTLQPIAIIQTAGDGRIFNSAGQDITQMLINTGVNVQSLRAAFASAPGAQQAQMSGVGAYPYGNIGMPVRRSPIRPYNQRGWIQ